MELHPRSIRGKNRRAGWLVSADMISLLPHSGWFRSLSTFFSAVAAGAGGALCAEEGRGGLGFEAVLLSSHQKLLIARFL
jgi:hypothetical protein